MLYPVKVTVPAAGEKTVKNVSGCTLIALVVPAVDDEEDAPKIFFDSKKSRRGPILPFAVLNDSGRGFGSFTVEGTAATAGDEITFLLSDSVIEQSVTLNPDLLFAVEPGPTFNRDSTDVAQGLAPADYTLGSKVARAVTITAEGNDIRIAFGGTSPDQTANPNGLGEVIKAGGFRRIEGAGFIETLEFISAVGGAHASVNFTMEF